MKAVVLAAGESTRMRPLTFARPKCMIPVAGKPALAHNLDSLKAAGVSEVILVVGFKAEQIKKYFGSNYKGLKLTYVLQKERHGTGHAYLLARDCVGDEDFIGMCGDDYYSAETLKRVIGNGCAIGAKRVHDPHRFGVLTVNKDKLVKITEKPKEPESNLVNIGLYFLTSAVFGELEKLKHGDRGEIEATDALNALANTVGVRIEEVNGWQPMGYSWHVLDLNKLLLENIEGEIKGDVSDGVLIEGNVNVGRGSKILPGTVIEGNVWIGDNCKIGPNAYIRGSTFIGNNSRVGNCVEMKNSVLFDNVYVSHLSYIGDSIIASGCNFGAGCITANLRHDNKSIRTLIKGKLVYTHKRKFGAVIGDYTKFGVNSSIAEGRVLGPYSWVDSHSFVHDNIPPGFLLTQGSLQEISQLREKFESL